MDMNQWIAYLSGDVSGWARFARGAVCFLGFLVAGMIIRFAVSRSLRILGVDRSVILLLGQSALYLILVLGSVTALGTMGVNISALVAGLGLGGFALGFAFRDAVSNMLAGVLVLIYRPFQSGEKMTVAGFEGVVKEINLRYTVLETDDARQLIPNQVLFTTPVKVHRTPDMTSWS